MKLETLAFDPADAKATLAQLPTASALFALYGAEAHAEPYIGRTPNLQARLARLLQPSAKHPRRLQLAGRVRRICWRLTGSEFESLLLQYHLLVEVYGAKALERMHLSAPSFVRFLGNNTYPRISVTNRPSQRESQWAYGPFPSRTAAERFAEEALKLFLLRRCTEDLDPNPAHPGCVYSEMKMCLAPCYQGCTDERYGEEAAAVESFLSTRGESRLVVLRAERDSASAELEFEAAAALHAQLQRVESVRALASELVRPLAELRAVILQAAANPGEVAVFLFENGRLSGPSTFSTLGMRIQNEHSGSTSLFAQPITIEPILETTGIRDQKSGISKVANEPVPQADAPIALKGNDFSGAINDAALEGALAPEGSFSSESPDSPSFSADSIAPEATPPEGVPAVIDPPAKLVRGALDARMEAVLAALAQGRELPSPTQRQGHLALLKRWYYRPEVRRAGEIFFPDAEGRWPIKAMLRGVGRVAAKMLADGDRD
jgi:hypothetical protein